MMTKSTQHPDRMRRTLWLGTAMCALPLLSTPVPAQQAVPAEEDGGSYLETLLENNLSSPGREVEITGFKGALSSKAQLDSLSIADADGVWLRLENVELDWTRSALLQGRVEVNALRAENLDWPRMPLPSDALPSPEAQPFALPELPVSITIGDLGIEQANIGASILGQDVQLSLSGTMMLADGAGQTQLEITRRDEVQGDFTLNASYQNPIQEAAIDLRIREGKGGLLSQNLNLPGAPSVAFEINGAGPLSNFQATTTLSSDGAERLQGTLRLGTQQPTSAPQTQGDAAPLRQTFSANLGGDLTPLFAPEYRDFFGTDLRLNVSGSQLAGELRLDQLSLRSQAMRLDGMVTLQNGWPELIAIDGQIAAKAKDGRAAPVLLPLGDTPTQVERVRFALNRDAARGDDWQLDADIIGLRQTDFALSEARLAGRGQITTGNGVNQVAGDLSVTAEGIDPKDPALAQALGRVIDITTRFTLKEDDALTLSDMQMRGADYQLTGDLSLGRNTDGALTLTPDLLVEADDLSRFAMISGQSLSGQARLSAAGTLQPLSGAFDLNLSGQTDDLTLGQPQLDILLSGTSRLTLNGRRDANGTTIAPLQLQSEAALIRAEAALKSRGSTLDLRAELTDAARLTPELSGPASLTLTARQTDADDWHVQTTLNAPAQMRAETELTLSQVSGDAPTVAGTLSLSASDLSPYGALAALPVPLSGAIDLSLTGSGQPLQQLFDVTATLNSRDLAIANPIVDALLAGASTLRVEAQKTSDAPIFLRDVVINTPELQFTLTGSGDIQSADVQYTARLRDMALLGAGINGALSTEGQAKLAGGQWQIDSRHSGPGGASLRTTGRVAQDFADTALAIAGDLPLSLANALIQPRNISGFARVDLRVDGPPALSSLSGQITTRDARLSLPTLRQSIEAISGSVTLGGSRATLDLSARPALGGQVTLDGQVALDPTLRADLAVALRDVIARDPSLYDTTLSGRMSLTGKVGQGSAALRGQIDLGATELRIPANSAPSFASLPGLKHRNEPAAVRRLRGWAGLIEAPTTGGNSRASAIALDLQVNAPSQIFVRGRGLDAELGGALRVGGTTIDVIPEGQFDLIRGRLDILGNRLTLTEGLIQLQGAFDPFIRFVAETQADDVTAMISIEGEASAPVLGFSSTPDLPEDEVLSLLLFGREISSISPLQAVRLANALRTLSGQGGEGLTGGVRRELALDDLDVTTDEDGTAQARVGKYINENIYTEITADTAGNSRIDLNLQLSPSVTARGRLGSDGDTGIGLFIERDY